LFQVNDYKYAMPLVLAAALAGCGGGGGGGTTSASGTTSSASVTTTTQADTSSAAAATAVTGTVPLQNDVVDVAGSLVPAAYRDTVSKFSKAAGIEYRYGPSAASYGKSGNSGLPTWGTRGDQSYDPISIRVSGDRGCAPSSQGGFCGTWQIGGPLQTDSGDYSSSIVHTAYVADNPAANVGMSNLQALSMAHNTFAQKPEPSWTTGLSSGANDPAAAEYLNKGLSAREPVAVGRCYGRSGWCTNSLMVFQNGLIGTAGSNTSSNRATVQLASGKVPTAIAVTGSNEFALVTVWDTVNLKGQIAVIALAGLCNGCNPDNPGTWYNNWGEWNGVYPGLPNLGNTAYMKVLGYVDLPDSMRTPTEISASTGMVFEEYNRVFAPGTNDMKNYYALPLTDQSNRTSFDSGVNSNAYAKTGVAVVISKSEKRAAFIDLRPLFSYYRDKYFKGSQSDFNSMIASRGPGANQWPYTFDAVASQKPTVIKTVDFENRPTAVNVRPNDGPRRAFIATQEGTLHIYDLGNYLTASGGGAASEIVRKGGVTVGRNPTHIAYVKPHETTSVYTDGFAREVIVTSRGDRRIEWVKFASDFNSGVAREKPLTLTDTRLVDPIATEDAENHGTESYILSVADYGGKQLSNYRYGPVVFWTNQGSGKACQPPNGCATSGTFEFGGSYALPGSPFQAAGSNIP
jgi:hypothetical protein